MHIRLSSLLLLVTALLLVGWGATAAGAQDQASQTRRAPVTLDTSLTWDLPAQPLAAALSKVGELTGLTLVLTSSLPTDATSAAVVGTFSVQDALDSLLAGSTVRWSAVDHRTLAIEPLSFQAESVVVTASGFEQLTRQAPASITVLGAKDLQTRRYNSLAHALVDVEGVDIDASAGKSGGLNISMRGMPSDYTLVLIDGRRQNAAGNVTPNGFNETANSFMPPLSAIERIEVVRGPMSTLYGSDAMGGVVNIITRRIARQWSGATSLDTTLQQNIDFGNTSTGSVSLSGPLVADRVALGVRGSVFNRAASHLSYDAVDGTPVEISRRGPSPVQSLTRTVGGTLNVLPLPGHELSFDADASWQHYDNSLHQLGTLGVQGGYSDSQRFTRQQAVLSHVWRLPFGVLDSDVSRNTTETIGRTLPPGTPGKTAGDPRTLSSANTIVNTRLRAARGAHTVTVGAQRWLGRMVDGVAPAPYTHTQDAIFAEDEWRLVPQLALTMGVRHDRHSTFGGKTSPRAYLVWTPQPQWTVKGGVSRGFKTPRLDQIADGITGFTGQGTRPTIGTPTLKPETSTSAEASVHYATGPVGASVTLFTNDFQDKIANGSGLPNCSFALVPNRPGCVDYGMWPAVDLFGQSINVDEAVTRGIESSLRLSVGRLLVTTNYTFTDSEVKIGEGQGRPLSNTPAHMVNANLRVQASERWSLWVRGEGRSARDRGVNAAATALGPYKGYQLYHLGGAYTVSSNVTVNATVYNLLNQDFLRYLSYSATNGTVSYASQYSNHQEPRRLWLSVAVTF